MRVDFTGRMPRGWYVHGMAAHPYLAGAPLPRILAHRGLVTNHMRDEGIAENTIAAFAAAHAAGVTFIESDCHLTSDGEVVLFHDDRLDRVAGIPRAVADVTLAELESIMSTRGGLATLDQALTAFPDSRFNIDVKAEGAAERAGTIVARHANRVLVTSFSDARRRLALRAARAGAGSPATSPGKATIVALVLATRITPVAGLVRRLLRGIDALQIPERHGRITVLTPRLIAAAHDAGVEVHVWTVNNERDMRRLVALGVDGIVTDRADLALTVFAG